MFSAAAEAAPWLRGAAVASVVMSAACCAASLCRSCVDRPHAPIDAPGMPPGICGSMALMPLMAMGAALLTPVLPLDVGKMWCSVCDCDGCC